MRFYIKMQKIFVLCCLNSSSIILEPENECKSFIFNLRTKTHAHTHMQHTDLYINAACRSTTVQNSVRDHVTGRLVSVSPLRSAGLTETVKDPLIPINLLSLPLIKTLLCKSRRFVTLIDLRKKNLFQSLCKRIKICPLELGRESQTSLEPTSLRTADPKRKPGFIKLPLSCFQKKKKPPSGSETRATELCIVSDSERHEDDDTHAPSL